MGHNIQADVWRTSELCYERRIEFLGKRSKTADLKRNGRMLRVFVCWFLLPVCAAFDRYLPISRRISFCYSIENFLSASLLVYVGSFNYAVTVLSSCGKMSFDGLSRNAPFVVSASRMICIVINVGIREPKFQEYQEEKFSRTSASMDLSYASNFKISTNFFRTPSAAKSTS